MNEICTRRRRVCQRAMASLPGWSLLGWSLLGGALLLSIGCEPAPRAVTDLPALPQPLVLADAEQGDYNWPLGRTGFIVTKPPPFAFLRNADAVPAVVQPTKPAVDAPPLDAETLADMLGDVGTGLPHPFSQNSDFETLVDIDVGAADTPPFCLSPDGKRLLVCGNELRVYDAENGQLLSSDALPASALQACAWPVGKHFYVADVSTVYRADAETGKVLGSVGELTDKLAMWQVAVDAEVVFGCYENGRVFRFDEQSTQLTELGIKAVGESKQVGVKPDGTGIVLTTARGLTTCLLEGDRIVSEEVTSVAVFGETVSLCWGPDGRHWSNGKRIYSLPSDATAGQQAAPDVSTRLLWRPIAMQAAAHDDVGSGWTAAVVIRNNMQGQPTLSVCEILPDRFIHSVPTPLPVAEDAAVSLSRNGKIVAYQDGDKLHVIRRQVWEHCSFARMWGGGWLQGGEFEQIDRFGQYLLANEENRWGYRSQELYASFVEITGMQWLRLKYAIDEETDSEQKQVMRATFEAARRWAKTSVLGQLALVELRIAMAWDARRGKAFPANSPSGWKLYEQQNKLARDELDALLADEDTDLPAVAYALRVSVAKMLGDPPAKLEPILKRAVARYPSDTRLNLEMVQLLMPQWSGNQGDSASYLDAVLKRCESVEADIAYARVVAKVMGMYDNPDAMFYYQKYDDARVVRGAVAYLAQNPTDRELLMHMLVTATFTEDVAAQQQLARYYQSHFMFVNRKFETTFLNFISPVYNGLP